LQWDPVNGAVAYLVAMARDSSFNSRVTPSGTYFVTTNTSLRIRPVLLDNSVGQPYFWFVLPCSSWTNTSTHTCGVGENQAINIPGEYASFNKLGKAVTGITSAPVQTDTVSLSWQDQLLTSPDGGGTKWYELEVRNAANQVVDTLTTDATGYTPIHKTYADGAYTWHVRAIDASGTALAWSADGAFQKKSSVPAPLAPAAFDTLPVLRWTPTSFAASYDVEIYRGVDPSFPAGSKISGAGVSDVPYPSATLPTALPADTYSWRVRQVDAAGKPGPWSTAILPFTVGGTKPVLDLPADGSTRQVGSLVFRWSAVPGAVRYRLQSSTTPGFANLTDAVITPGTSYGSTVAHTGGATYYWRVSALNANDDTLATSDPRSFTALTAPSQLVASAAPQGSSIVVTWPVAGDGGTAITGYVVRYRIAGTTTWTELSVAGDVLSTTLGTLPVNTKYDVQVAAVNAAGTGRFSTLVGATTATVPGVPGGLKLAPVAHGFTVSWVAPGTSGGAPVTGYDVRVTKAGDTTSTESTVTTATTTLTGLADGTVYTVEVAAQNTAGLGPFASAQGTTPGSAPSAVVVTLTGTRKVVFGQAAPLRGALKTSTGVAIPGVGMTIQSRPTGTTTWLKLAQVTTDATGAFSTTVRPLVNSQYRAVVGVYASATAPVGVAPRISLSRTALHAKLRSTVRVAGKVAPATAGKPLILECRAGGHWTRMAGGRTASGGAFRLAVRLTTGGSHTCRVAMPADTTHAAAHSGRVSIFTA